jgi:hypothetical protein
MKYYKIDFQGIFSEEDKVLGHANGEFVPDGREYFYRIGKGEIIEDAPIFDYFHLQSYGEKEEWEWRLQDIHGFICVGSIITGWYISDDFKMLLETFKIAPKYHFYETRLLYKGKKLKYWIFQFPIEPLKNIDFEKSKFYYIENKIVQKIEIKSQDEFMHQRRELLLGYNIDLECSKICFKDKFDIIYNLPCGDILCSEKLKTAIETMKLEGFLFSELDYEVLVEK